LMSDYKSSGKTDLDETTISYVKSALHAGLHHIDGAQSYGNEEEIGHAIKSSGVPRSSIFLTTKLAATNVSSPKKALEESLKRLQVDHVDLYLIHHPYWSEQENGITLEEVWQVMEQVHSLGLAKAIGVSNFQIEHLERVKKVAKVMPAINQIEWHP
jgi:diketogulonate reductase-like aldo/keto reductase